jgi:hypothetical protein
MVKALKLRRVDEDFNRHAVAFLSYAVQATKGTARSQRPVYRRFEDFFDYEKALQRADDKPQTSRFSRLSQYLKQKKQKEKEKGTETHG